VVSTMFFFSNYLRKNNGIMKIKKKDLNAKKLHQTLRHNFYA
jgi:hypothetical protein